jgi:hypothetical protein
MFEGASPHVRKEPAPGLAPSFDTKKGASPVVDRDTMQARKRGPPSTLEGVQET